MTNAYEIKKVMELVELIKETVGIDGIDAFKLLQQWTSEDSKESKISIDPNNHKWDKGVAENEIADILVKQWSDCIAKIESNSKIEATEKFKINTIPLQLLTIVNRDTHNNDIESILLAIKNLKPSTFGKCSKEGVELVRIEKLLEDRIIENMDNGNYRTLANSTSLLRKVKDMYYDSSITTNSTGTLTGHPVK